MSAGEKICFIVLSVKSHTERMILDSNVSFISASHAPHCVIPADTNQLHPDAFLNLSGLHPERLGYLICALAPSLPTFLPTLRMLIVANMVEQ